MNEEMLYREMFEKCHVYNIYNPFVDRNKFSENSGNDTNIGVKLNRIYCL